MIGGHLRRFYPCMALLCGVGVFAMSSVFQDMAYWGNGLVWYWIGVGLTALIWVVGIVMTIFTLRKNPNTSTTVLVGTFLIVLFIIGLCWDIFIIIAGMSGM